MKDKDPYEKPHHWYQLEDEYQKLSERDQFYLKVGVGAVCTIAALVIWFCQ